MADTALKIKRSQTTATPTVLKEGELAYSYASGTLFIGGPGGTTVIPITFAQAVNSVNGQTGDVILGYADVGAAAEVHEHVAADVTDFEDAVNALIPEIPVTSVNGEVGDVVLTNTDVGAAATVHDHVAADIVDFDDAVTALIPPPLVTSVNGDTGDVVLTNVDVGAAATVHTHTASQITDFQTAVEGFAPVKSVNGQNGVITLTNTDVGAAATVHGHVSTDIADFTAAVNALIPAPPVTSVNGEVGAVVLTNTSVGAAATVHTHTSSQITDFSTAVDAKIALVDLNDLADVNANSPTDGQLLSYDTTTSTWIPITPSSGGALTFLDLTDVPNVYTGQAGRIVAVNGTENGLLFATEIDGGSY